MKGQGSRFWFAVRLAKSGQMRRQVVPAEAHWAVPKSYTGEHVLFIEPDPVAREVVLTLMQDTGLTVMAAENGSEALSLAEGHRFALLLVEMQVPDMDGAVLCHELRKRYNKGIPLLAMTANPYGYRADTLHQLGVSQLIAKPVEPRRLHQILTDWLLPSYLEPLPETHQPLNRLADVDEAKTDIPDSPPGDILAVSSLNEEMPLNESSGSLSAFELPAEDHLSVQPEFELERLLQQGNFRAKAFLRDHRNHFMALFGSQWSGFEQQVDSFNYELALLTLQHQRQQKNDAATE